MGHIGAPLSDTGAFRWLDNELHSLALTVKGDPAMEGVRRRRIKPWKVLARYLDRMGQPEAEAVCLRLYTYVQLRRGRDLPPTGGSAA